MHGRIFFPDCRILVLVQNRKEQKGRKIAHEQKTKESNNHRWNNRGSLFDLQVPAAPRYSIFIGFCFCTGSMAGSPFFESSSEDSENMGSKWNVTSLFWYFFGDIVDNWWKTGGTVGFFCG